MRGDSNLWLSDSFHLHPEYLGPLLHDKKDANESLKRKCLVLIEFGTSWGSEMLLFLIGEVQWIDILCRGYFWLLTLKCTQQNYHQTDLKRSIILIKSFWDLFALDSIKWLGCIIMNIILSDGLIAVKCLHHSLQYYNSYIRFLHFKNFKSSIKSELVLYKITWMWLLRFITGIPYIVKSYQS